MEHIEWIQVLKNIGWVLGAILTVASPFLLAYIFYKLGQRDLFFTIVDEGEAKAVLVNGQFRKMVMAFRGHRFRRNMVPSDSTTDPLYDPNDKEASYWDVVKEDDLHQKITRQILLLVGGLFGGLRWIGIPPFAKIHKYRFEWVTLEYERSPDGVRITSSKKVPTTHKEDVNRILVQQFTYIAQVGEAETQVKVTGKGKKPEPGMPVDVDLLLNVSIVNPFKALFRVKHWLQTMTNQTEASVRVFIGSKEVEELFDKGAASGELAEKLKIQIANFVKQFGASINPIQIQSVDPAGNFKDEYRRLSTLKYQAEQKAKELRTGADAESYWVDKVFGAVTAHENGADMYKWRQMPETNLTTYIEGEGKKRVGVMVNAGSASGPPAPTSSTTPAKSKRGRPTPSAPTSATSVSATPSTPPAIPAPPAVPPAIPPPPAAPGATPPTVI